MGCSICKSQKSKKIFCKDNFTFHRCMLCDHVYINPMPTEDELSVFYTTEYFDVGKSRGYEQGYEKFGELQRNSLQKILRNINCLMPGAKSLLDIGCAYGVFMSFAQQFGLKVEGIELSKSASDYAIKNYSLSVHHGTLNTYIQMNSEVRFDVITMLDVLEHLSNPRNAIQIASNLLVPGGILVVKVPNISSLRAKIEGERWRQIKPPEHIQYFSKRSIEYLLAKHNLQIMKISAVGGVGINAVRNTSIKFSNNLFYKIIKVPVVKIAKVFGWLDQLEIYAKKI